MFPPAEVSSSPVHGCGEVLGPAGRGQQPVLEVSLVERHPGADVCGRSSLLLCISVPVGQRKLTQFYTLTTFHSRSVLNPEPVFAKMFWGKPPTVDRCVVSPQPWAFRAHNCCLHIQEIKKKSNKKSFNPHILPWKTPRLILSWATSLKSFSVTDLTTSAPGGWSFSLIHKDSWSGFGLIFCGQAGGLAVKAKSWCLITLYISPIHPPHHFYQLMFNGKEKKLLLNRHIHHSGSNISNIFS